MLWMNWVICYIWNIPGIPSQPILNCMKKQGLNLKIKFSTHEENIMMLWKGENPKTKKYECISSLLRTIFVSQLIERRESSSVAYYCIKFLYSRDWNIDTDLPLQEICPSYGVFDAEWMHPLIKLLTSSFCNSAFLWRGFRLNCEWNNKV